MPDLTHLQATLLERSGLQRIQLEPWNLASKGGPQTRGVAARKENLPSAKGAGRIDIKCVGTE